MMNKICYVVTLQSTINAFFVPQIKYLADNGFFVDIIGSPTIDLSQIIGENKNIKIIPISIPRGFSVLKTLKAIILLKKIFINKKYELVQYSTPNAAFCSAIASKLAHVKIRNYHLMGFRFLGFKGIKKWVFKQVEKFTCRLSTHIECVSNSNKEFGIQERIFPKSKVTVVWNGSSGGVDLNRFSIHNRHKWRNEIRNDLGISDSKFVLGYVGRITRDKGINELFEAFLQLKSDAVLLVIGQIEKGAQIDQELFARIKKNDRVIIHGPVSDIERYYSALDVLVLPSYREGFGNVVIEAAAVGTPAIVTRIPGPVDTIKENETALVVPVKDPAAIAQAIEAIYANNNYIEMGENAHAFVESRFDSNALSEHILIRKKELLNGYQQ